MTFITNIFLKLYQYLTVFIVVASPLFFIPHTGFSPELTYRVVIMIATAVALISYVIVGLITRSWHTISKLEFVSYGLFSVALVCSVVFSRDPSVTLIGDGALSQSALCLLSLPMILYLVRSLPETLRHKTKIVLIAVLTISVITFITSKMTPASVPIAAQLFGGFPNVTSLAAYLGIFTVLLLVYARKGLSSVAVRALIAALAIGLSVWIVGVGIRETTGPDVSSSVVVAQQVLLHEGIFGVGAGQYARAWQLYRPTTAVLAPSFGSDFEQGFSVAGTLAATIGVFGLCAFLLLMMSALYSAYRSYKEAHQTKEKYILAVLGIALAYLSIVMWVAPLSYALLVVAMSLAGLGLARAKLTSFHPSKKMAYILVPAALLLGFYAFHLTQSARALMLFNTAQTRFAANGQSDEVEKHITDAIRIAPNDLFYRAHIEYLISVERALVASETQDQEALKEKYLKIAQRAVDAGLAAVTYNKNNYQNYVSLGRAYELAMPFDKDGGFDRANKSYLEAVKLYPNNPYLYVMLARLEAAHGNKAGVRVQLTEALKKKQNFADALYLMSQLEASENKGDEALAYALEAVKNAPNDPLVYIQAGLLLYGKKDYQNAVAALQIALQKDPNNANVAYFLALSLRDGGRPDLAKQIGEELLKRNPGNADLEAFLRSVNAPAPAVSTPSTAAKK